MNDKTQKIAAEAAPKIRQAIANGVTDKYIEAIIQSAIEKADLVWRETAEALLKEKESRAAHASEPKQFAVGYPLTEAQAEREREAAEHTALGGTLQ